MQYGRLCASERCLSGCSGEAENEHTRVGVAMLQWLGCTGSNRAHPGTPMGGASPVTRSGKLDLVPWPVSASQLVEATVQASTVHHGVCTT